MRSICLILCLRFFTTVLFAQEYNFQISSQKNMILCFLMGENQKDYAKYSGNILIKVGGVDSSIFSNLDAHNINLSKINADQSLDFLNLASNYEKVIYLEFTNTNSLIYITRQHFQAYSPKSAHCKIFYLLDSPLSNTYIVYFEYFYSYLYGAVDVYKLKLENNVVKVIDKKTIAVF